MCCYLGLLLGSVVIAAAKMMMASSYLMADTACATAGFNQMIWDWIKTIIYGMCGWQKL